MSKIYFIRCLARVFNSKQVEIDSRGYVVKIKALAAKQLPFQTDGYYRFTVETARKHIKQISKSCQVSMSACLNIKIFLGVGLIIKVKY